MNNIWRKEEDNFLFKYYKTYGIKLCSQELRRTEKAILHRAEKLGITSQRKTEQQWNLILTKNQLYEDYIVNSLTINEIRNKYKCSIERIQRKLKEYNLYIPNTNNKYLNKINELDIKFLEDYKGYRHTTKFQCHCGKIFQSSVCTLLKNKKPSCGCLSSRVYGENHTHWTGYGEISGHMWSNIRNSAKQRDLEFHINIIYTWNLFLQQNRKCVFTGLELKFKKHYKDDTTASLDRIDSSKGYIEGNVQWIHKDVNKMKQDFSDEYFIYICNLISNKRGKIYEKLF